jgi:hypothetical protein
MKKCYRKSNTYSPKDLMSSIDHPLIHTLMMPEDGFKDWFSLEDLYFDAPKGETEKNHCFTVDIDRDNGNTMYFQEYDSTESPETSLQLVHEEFHDKDMTWWRNIPKPTTLTPPGLVDIK